MTLAEAQARCAERERRLCTVDELASNKCCETGCGYDHVYIWQTDSVSESGNNNQGKPHMQNFFLNNCCGN